MKNTTPATPSSLLSVVAIVAVTLGMYLATSFSPNTLAEKNNKKAPTAPTEYLIKKVSTDSGKSIIEKQKKKLMDKINLPKLLNKN